MDYTDNGTEHQVNTCPATKRPPPIAKKPSKPIPPKKPSLAAKPTHLIQAVLPINGETEPTLPPILSKPAQLPPAQPTPRPTELSSVKPASPRPKQPPPPLPSSSPKGPSVSKTPPPLPKTPPRGGSVKSHSRKPLTPKLPTDTEDRSNTPSPSSEGTSSVVPTDVSSDSTFPNTPNTDIPTCDIDTVTPEKNSIPTAVSENTQKDNELKKDEDFAFSNLKSKFSGSNEKLAPKPHPKVPVKPKPRLLDRNGLSSSSENLDNKVNGITKTSVNDTRSEKNGKSTWFVASEEFAKDKTKEVLEKYKDETGNSEVQLKFEKQDSETSCKVQYRRTNSPAQSPRLPRKPPPRTPNKPSKSFVPKDCVLENTSNNNTDTNANFNSSSCDTSVQVKSGEHKTETFRVGDDAVNSAQTSSICDANSKDSEKRDFPETYPKPVPRPAPRPRPTPRKRQSLNRLSGTEETLSGQLLTGSVHDLSEDCDQRLTTNLTNNRAKSEDSVFLVSQGLSLASREICIDDNADAKTDIGENARKFEETTSAIKSQEKSEGGSKITSLVKSRVVFSEKGEQKQYRIIDKTIVRSHVTDVTNADSGTSVVLRKTSKTLTGDEEINKGKNLESSKGKKQSEPKDISADVNVSVNKNTIGADKDGARSSDHKCKSSENDDERAKVNEAVKDSFEDLLSDKSILEPSSLLNEIEEILSRSYKHSSLTRSGSSPEKTNAPSWKGKGNVRYERSRSVDINSESTPVRPPRPKKEQKRLRSRSQVMYDSCGSDTESLPDLSRTREDVKSDLSLTLPPAKPHPPKPKRNKLLKVQRSHSDITAMKSVMDKQDKKSPAVTHKRQMSDAGPYQDDGNHSPNLERPTSWRKNRPSRKAPPPPSIPPFKVTPPSPSVDISTVVPVSKNNSGHKKRSKDKTKLRHLKHQSAVKDTSGSLYSCINDDDVIDSSDGDHDYHYISDDAEHYEAMTSNNTTGMVKVNQESRGKSSPPKLPPRNLNNSHSFETSSLSSTSHDFDNAITGAASSIDDLSVSSGCLEPENGLKVGSDLVSPGVKGLKNYPKTSSPNIKHRLLVDSDSSEQSGAGKRSRPVSGTSFQSDDDFGESRMDETPQSSSESDLDDEEKAVKKREKKLFMIAQEITSSERVFVDVLHLLNIDFRRHISETTETLGRPVIANEILNRILDYLPQLQNFNEDLLRDLEDRVSNWEQKKSIADIFVRKGPFLKLYSSYIKDFEIMTSTLDEAVKKYPAFQTALKEFEMGSRCAQLALKHYMLKPIQRIPQYRMLLQDYIKHMPPDSTETKDMQTALAIVSEVAHHANENMRHGDYIQKMLEIQRSIIGQFEVIKPGRVFLKEGELMKLSRKEMQPRYFFMFNDVLLYTTPVATGYRLNNILPLAGMKVSVPAQDDFKTEFSIISVQRSFTLHAATIEEREDWVTALNAAIEENALKRNTFEAVRAGAQVLLDKDFVLGHKAPLWIPDARVTMCMLCTCEFTVTWRRHHCRACGRVVCGNCSDNKSTLRYLKYKTARVCDECFKTLTKETIKGEETVQKNHSTKESGEGKLSSFFDRFNIKNKSGRSDKKNTVARPHRLVIKANDEGASMSGYLHRFQKGKKWKKDWFLIKDKVLYTFKATQNTAADESMALLGYEVFRFTEYFEGTEPDLLFQLSHTNTEPIVFRTDSATATEKWVTVMRESSVA